MKIWLMKIGEILPVNGVNQLFRYGHTAMALAERGHNVTWWSSTFSHVHKQFLFDQACSIELRPNLQLRLLHGPPYRRNVSLQRIAHHRAIAAGFRAAASDSVEKPDLILCSLPTLELAAEAIRYGQAANIPVIIDILDRWPDIYLILLPRLLQSPARLLLRPEFEKARRICQQATAITAVSQTYLEWGLAHAGRACSALDQVFPLGCTSLDSAERAEILARGDTIRAQYGASPDALLATFAGTFGVSYDLQTIARAAALLDREQGSRVRFVFAGDGDKGPEVRALTQHLTNVVCTGWIKEAPLRELLHVSSVGLASYTDKALQSLPNKPFEYMAAGLPIVSSLRGELEATIHSERIGRYYRAGDAPALAEQLRWCAANPDELRAMSARARQLFEHSYETGQIYGRFVEHLTEISGIAAQKHLWPASTIAAGV